MPSTWPEDEQKLQPNSEKRNAPKTEKRYAAIKGSPEAYQNHLAKRRKAYAVMSEEEKVRYREKKRM